MQKIVSSRDNPLLKRARAVRDGRVPEQIFIEGLRLCEEAASASLDIHDVLYTEELMQNERGRRLLEKLRAKAKHLVSVSEQALASVADTRTPQGIIALASRPETSCEALEIGSTATPPLLLVMHRINNPSNAGAILRTTEAAGATGAATTYGSADIFSPRALRGAMGSSFRLPLWTGAQFEEVLDWCRGRGLKTVCADAHAALSYTEIDWTEPYALIVGPEASGLTEEEARSTNEAVRIPMHGEVESLNVAAASAILLYEAARQRAKQFSVSSFQFLRLPDLATRIVD
jgi:TrmH family RNA methyltransferase